MKILPNDRFLHYCIKKDHRSEKKRHYCLLKDFLFTEVLSHISHGPYSRFILDNLGEGLEDSLNHRFKLLSIFCISFILYIDVSADRSISEVFQINN